MQVLLLSAGSGWRIKSKEPRSLLEISGKTLIRRQKEQIDKYFPENKTCLISGYKAGKVKKECKAAGVNHINNPEYATTNQLESLRIFFESNNVNQLLIIHGDLNFKINFDSYNFNESFVLYDKCNNFKNTEVGINIVNGVVNNLSYGLDTKWSQIFNVVGKELDLLKNICKLDKKYLLTFELINEILKSGGCFNAYPHDGFIYEIDTLEEINNADFNC